MPRNLIITCLGTLAILILSISQATAELTYTSKLKGALDLYIQMETHVGCNDESQPDQFLKATLKEYIEGYFQELGIVVTFSSKEDYLEVVGEGEVEYSMTEPLILMIDEMGGEVTSAVPTGSPPTANAGSNLTITIGFIGKYFYDNYTCKCVCDEEGAGNPIHAPCSLSKGFGLPCKRGSCPCGDTTPVGGVLWEGGHCEIQQKGVK